MREQIERLKSAQSGSVLPLVALSMMVLMGLAALAVDVGRMYVERERLSAVADVAALSAAPYLMTDPEAVPAVVREYMAKNGLDDLPATVMVDEAAREVSVKISNTIPMTFARVIGHEWGTTVAGATATVAALKGVHGAVPLGVAEADWQVGDPVVLKLSPNDGSVSPGNYQALSLGRNGASMYEQNLMNGYQSWLRVGEWIETEPGSMAGPTVRAARYRIGLDPFATYETVTKGSPRLLQVPVLQDFTVNGRGEVQIVGFAMFFLEQVEETGPDKGEITGRFLRIVVEGEADGSAPDFGLVATKLVQ